MSSQLGKRLGTSISLIYQPFDLLILKQSIVKQLARKFLQPGNWKFQNSRRFQIVGGSVYLLETALCLLASCTTVEFDDTRYVRRAKATRVSLMSALLSGSRRINCASRRKQPWGHTHRTFRHIGIGKRKLYVVSRFVHTLRDVLHHNEQRELSAALRWGCRWVRTEPDDKKSWECHRERPAEFKLHTWNRTS